MPALLIKISTEPNLASRGDHIFNLRRLADICLRIGNVHTIGGLPVASPSIDGVVVSEAIDHQACTLCRKSARDRAPDAARGASNKRHLPLDHVKQLQV